jgi:hypothetical protein
VCKPTNLRPHLSALSSRLTYPPSRNYLGKRPRLNVTWVWFVDVSQFSKAIQSPVTMSVTLAPRLRIASNIYKPYSNNVHSTGDTIVCLYNYMQYDAENGGLVR